MSVASSEDVGGRQPPAPSDARLARHLFDVVTQAGAIALAMFRTGVKSWSKDNDSPVTEADIAVDRFLHEKLTAFAPDYGWLSEETADSAARLTARRVWVVDPIDGTRGYMTGAPDWAVSVALVEDGRPVLAALYAPASTDFYAAVRGQGSTRNGVPLKAAQRQSLDGAAVAGPADALDMLARSASITRIGRGSSLALRLARVAAAEIDLAVSRGESHDWDLAAADLVVHEAEGCLTTYDGCPLRYNAPVPRHAPLICAGAALHPRVLLATRAADTSHPSH